MKKHILDLIVSAVERQSDRHTLLKLTHSQPLPDMLPGQFVEVRIVGSPTTFLRRPISVCNFDRPRNELWLLVAVIGDGTRALASVRCGDIVNCILPLGNGFPLPQSPADRALLVGGGVGVAPLLFLGQRIKALGMQPTFLLGARSATELLLLDEFEASGRVLITTEDGSRGERGFVTNHTALQRERFDIVYTCGPKPMMMSVARYAESSKTACYASLENMMACGLGACLCCVEKTTNGNVCVCTDGPVMNTNRLLWQI